jgi:ABC-type lipoprotein release transport system permease subunit
MALPIAYNVRGLYVRRGMTALAVVSIALVIAVLIVLIAMANGFRVALGATGSPANAIVTQRGSTSELTSMISRDGLHAFVDDERVARDADNAPLVSAELVVVASLERKDGKHVNATIRGVSQMAFAVRQGIAVTQGSTFRPGHDEVIVGRRLHERMKALEIGRSLTLQRREWRIVGVFEAGGSGFESEIWATPT